MRQARRPGRRRAECPAKKSRGPCRCGDPGASWRATRPSARVAGGTDLQQQALPWVKAQTSCTTAPTVPSPCLPSSPAAAAANKSLQVARLLNHEGRCRRPNHLGAATGFPRPGTPPDHGCRSPSVPHPGAASPSARPGTFSTYSPLRLARGAAIPRLKEKMSRACTIRRVG